MSEIVAPCSSPLKLLAFLMIGMSVVSYRLEGGLGDHVLGDGGEQEERREGMLRLDFYSIETYT